MGKREIKSVLKTRPGLCYLCKRQGDTALHHVYGAFNRWMSDENGFVVIVEEKQRIEGKKRPQKVEVEKHFTYDDVKWVKNIIDFK